MNELIAYKTMLNWSANWKNNPIEKIKLETDELGFVCFLFKSPIWLL